SLGKIGGGTVEYKATAAETSLHRVDQRLARLSVVFTGLRATTDLFAAPIAADHFEVHVRETPARSNEAWSATPPQQAQVVLAGTKVRFAGSAPLTLALDAGITATAPLRDLETWVHGGTVEIHDAVLSDASGEVARLSASIVDTVGQLRLTGTVTTVCPASVRAAVDGTPPVAESRLRNPVRLALGGTPGFFVLAPLPAGAPTAVRGQLPPCPRLR
ncbi:MAG: hypothetical protein JO290_06420, partial [Sphingomonadaceae bacterium]|nr:hypothetical protein [Sphingomonadaceae bacterium]